MVLRIRVKTLNSQDYQFEAQDDWTVSQFKVHIQETVNVPSEEQRLIFCGRVLQNDKKLIEYDCNDKVMHLVRRPPPPLGGTNESAANGNTNNNNNNNDEPRYSEDGNILFSAMTLGEGSINQILRQIMSLQQTVYSRSLSENLHVDSSTDLERRLNNASRLLRIVTSSISECVTRLPATSPLTSALSLSGPDPRDDSHVMAAPTADDTNVVRPSNREGLSRQSVSTEDLSATPRGQDPLLIQNYLNMLDNATQLQNQVRLLTRRFHELASLSRRGGFIVTPQTPSNLPDEARILSQYVPRILHHLSHLQHALSDFSMDMSRGTLRVTSSPQQQTSATDQNNRLARPRIGDLDGSMTITATTVETTPVVTTTAANMRPQASATIVVTAEPGPTVNMEIPLFQRHNQPSDQVPQARPRSSGARPTRPIGVISGRIPLPYDYYLTCFSPYINQRYDQMPEVRIRHNPMMPSARIQVRAARPQGAPNPQAPNPGPTSPPMDPGLTEVVSNIVDSIFRQPNQREGQEQQPQTNQNTGANQANQPNQDPFLNFIPELAINAASQILGGIFGIPASGGSGQQTQAQQSHQQQQQQPYARAPTMMDIDIDDSSSTQSESRYQDARDSVAATNAQHVGGPSTSRQGPSQADQRSRYNHLVEVMQNHSEWIPIIETDINIMEQQHQTSNESTSYFSDAYLNSIPRKRRRLLTATPDRVLILQPSPSQAITNLLKRAISSSTSSNVDSLDQLLSSIADDSDLQSAYEDYIKAAVETRLKLDDDYCPEKFENSSKYFK